MFAHATRIKYFDAARSETGWPSHSLLARSPEGRWGLYAAEPIAEGTYLFQLGGAMTDASDSVRAGARLSSRGNRCEYCKYPQCEYSEYPRGCDTCEWRWSAAVVRSRFFRGAVNGHVAWQG